MNEFQDYKVDYHIHTTASDGNMSPASIVRQAKEIGFEIIAITDHDNISGVEEAMIAGEAVGLKVVPGVEVGTEDEEERGMHLLGYDFDLKSEEMLEFLDRLIMNRDVRNAKLLKVLEEMGYVIPHEDLEMDIGNQDFLGKPIIARAMVKNGYIDNVAEAFTEKIFGSPQCKAVKKVKPRIEDAIATINNAGGIPVLAHPIQIKGIGIPGSEEFYENLEEKIKHLKKAGLKGIECYHPDHNEENSLRFVAFAEKYHLHITRGSDFHGADYIEANRTGVFR